MPNLDAAIAALPLPTCPKLPGVPCLESDKERCRTEPRPDEIDVSVRCRACNACTHYVLDPATGEVLDAKSLAARRDPKGSPSPRPSPKGEPAAQPPHETPDSKIQ